MFLEDTLALKNRYLGRFSVYFVMSREPQHTQLLNGRIDAAKIEALAREISDIGAADEYFVCGPGSMVDEVREALRRLNESAPVRFERFATAADAMRGAGCDERTGRGAPFGREEHACRARCLERSPRDHFRDHGRQAPHLPDGARRSVGARGRRARGARAAVLVPLRNLRHVPHQDRRRGGSHGAQYRARALGDEGGLRPVLSGAPDDAVAGIEL